MLNKLLKFIGCVIVIGVFAFTIMYEAVPDLNSKGKIKAADQSAEVLVPTKNQQYIARCEKINEILKEYGWSNTSDQELSDFFEKPDAENDEYTLGTAAEKNAWDYDDECYYTFSASEGGTVEEYEKEYTFKINGNQIDWYCKKHNRVALSTPYMLYDSEGIKKLDQELPGFSEWVKDVENISNATMVETTDHIKVPLEGIHDQSKAFDGIFAKISQNGVEIWAYSDAGYCYDNLTDAYEKMEKEGWNLTDYYVDGVEKGFRVTTGEMESPSIIVKMDGEKITEILISATDFTQEKKPLDSVYVERVNAVLNAAGLKDSIDEVYQMKNNGKGDNYKVYVSKCGVKFDETGLYDDSYEVEFQNYLIDIYDIQ